VFVVHAPCAPDVREPNTFRPARLEPDLEEGSAEGEQRRGHRASQTPPTVQGVALIDRQIIHGNLGRTAAPRQSEHLLLQAAGHIVTIAGSSGRWNPRVDTPRHKQIFGDLDGGEVPSTPLVKQAALAEYVSPRRYSLLDAGQHRSQRVIKHH
jgi:hypothetical protein